MLIAGCGGEDEPPPSPEPQPLDVVGSWRLDVDRTLQRLREDDPERDLGMFESEGARRLLGRLGWVFDSQGVALRHDASGEERFRYQVSDDRLVLEEGQPERDPLAPPGSEPQPDVVEYRLERTGRDTLVLHLPDGPLPVQVYERSGIVGQTSSEPGSADLAALVGTWQLDFEASLARIEESPADADLEALRAARAEFEQLRWQFRADGTATRGDRTGERTFSDYRLVGDALILDAASGLAATVLALDDETLVLQMPGERLAVQVYRRAGGG